MVCRQRPRRSGGSGRRRAPLNYRHHFHAGNFADLLKHALTLQVLERLMADPGSLAILDTHAGAGLYDLEGEHARRSGEAAQGVVRLMADPSAPAEFNALKRAVEGQNPAGGVRFYPGSPVLIAARLRPGDHYTGCELRPDDVATLTELVRPWPGARARLEDGYAALAGWTARGRRLALIDPPFERGDEYARIAASSRAALAANPATVLAIWTPLKDLETFDSFLGRLEAIDGLTGLSVQARLKPLDDPLRMNGCALVIVGPPALLDDLEPACASVAGWVVSALGGPHGVARVERVG